MMLLPFNRDVKARTPTIFVNGVGYKKKLRHFFYALIKYEYVFTSDPWPVGVSGRIWETSEDHYPRNLHELNYIP